LDQYEETRQYVHDSVVKLQRKIKGYLGGKMNKGKGKEKMEGKKEQGN
jgi:hypothetical protein